MSATTQSAATQMDERWLKPADWAWVQKKLPIVCVDVLPIRFSSRISRDIEAVGLIMRATERGTLGWCLIGGRLLFGEPLMSAIKRQVKETLGDHVHVSSRHESNPTCIAQYSPLDGRPFYLDPRQHAVGLTYAVEMRGTPDPRGEATGFEWFKPRNLPPSRQFGFDQDRVVRLCLNKLRTR